MSRVSVEDALVDADEEREARARAEVLEQDDAVARKCSAVEVPLHELVVTSKIGRGECETLILFVEREGLAHARDYLTRVQKANLRSCVPSKA